MATLKITPKSSDAQKPIKAPVRRADPAKRDRSAAPVFEDKEKLASEKPAQEKPVVSKASQRNHRFDGKAHGSPFAEPAADVHKEVDANVSKPATEPYTSQKPVNAKAGYPRANQSSATQYKADEYKPENRQAEPKQPRPAGVDTRVSPPKNREEPQYRQAPRRGGKVRDGFDGQAKQYGAAAKAAYKPVPAQPDLPRLSKRMAELGLCSRREADEWIVNGWVMVDGVILDTLGVRIQPNAVIEISGYAYEQQAEQVTILLHKPVGFVSGQAEDDYEPAIVLVHPDQEWLDDPDLNERNQKEFQRGFLRNLAPAGRLDIDSTGLLVLTQDGRIARHLIGEDSSVEKEYLVRVEGTCSEADLKRLNHGLSLDGEPLKPAKVSWQNEDQLRFVLREGKKRQIRRMCEMVGLHVVGLKRVRIGSINLGKLPLGQWRYLRAGEKF